MTSSLGRGKLEEAEALLARLAADENVDNSFRTFLASLQAIVAGSRDRTLAEASELNCMMAAEILLLIETLERQS